jgi:hypothetical protein
MGVYSLFRYKKKSCLASVFHACLIFNSDGIFQFAYKPEATSSGIKCTFVSNIGIPPQKNTLFSSPICYACLIFINIFQFACKPATTG